jgi:hypothetical protein
MPERGDLTTIWVFGDGRRYLPGNIVRWHHGVEDTLVGDPNRGYEVHGGEHDPAESPGRRLKATLRKIS